MIINELQEMRAVGASEEEIRLYRDNKIREMKAVVATDSEIQTELCGSKLKNKRHTRVFFFKISKVFSSNR